MSLLENVQNLKFKDMDKDLKIGKMPSNCEVVDIDDKKVDLMPLSMPRDKSELRFKTGEPIAVYQKSINAWALVKGLSPDVIPEIKGRPTISYEQYQYMATYAKYMNETRYRWAGYEFGIQDGYKRQKYEPGYDSVDWHRSNSARNKFLDLSLRIKDLLKNISKEVDVKDVYEYSKTKGDNRHSNPKKTGSFRITYNDVMHCLFGNTQRIKEFENSYEEKNIENATDKNIEYFAIGSELITKQELEEWKSYFKAGTTPKDMSVFEYYDFDDNRHMHLIPKTPSNEVHSLDYCGYPFATFKDYGWHLCCTSNIEGIPPITHKEISNIYGCETRTDKSVMQQRKEIESNGINIEVAKQIQEKQLEETEKLKEIQKEKAKHLFAIGKNQVTQLQIDDWKEDFQRGQFPKGFSIFHYVDYEDNCDLIRIPEKPIANEHTMTYNGEPFARFNGITWELIAKSQIDGIPPITSDEIDRIYLQSTETSREVIAQRDDIRFGTIDDIINSKNSDINMQNIDAKERKEMESNRE